MRAPLVPRRPLRLPALAGGCVLASTAALAWAAVAAAGVIFTDATGPAGLSGVAHVHGGTGRKYYVETVPPGFEFAL